MIYKIYELNKVYNLYDFVQHIGNFDENFTFTISPTVEEVYQEIQNFLTNHEQN
jgi:hypothetical protein